MHEFSLPVSNKINQIFLALRRKCTSFYLNDHLFGRAAHLQRLFFFEYIVVSELKRIPG